MIKIALVGDIGSGKTFISKLFKYPVFNADLEVSKLYKDRNIIKKIKKTFPNQNFSSPIKKNELINCILSNSNNLKRLSKIVHPMIRKKMFIFLSKNKSKKFLILDIPLYLENKLNRKQDIIVFIESKNKDIKSRLLKRKNYNGKLLKLLKKIQLPLVVKKRKSNFIIKNNFSIKKAKKSIKHILTNLRHERNNT